MHASRSDQESVILRKLRRDGSGQSHSHHDEKTRAVQLSEKPDVATVTFRV